MPTPGVRGVARRDPGGEESARLLLLLGGGGGAPSWWEKEAGSLLPVSAAAGAGTLVLHEQVSDGARVYRLVPRRLLQRGPRLTRRAWAPCSGACGTAAR